MLGPTMPRKNITTGVSMTPEMREKTGERARGLGLSLSAYVQQLIWSDLERRGKLAVTEDPTGYHPKEENQP